MLLRKLTNTLLSIGIIAFVIISSYHCNNGQTEDHSKTDTVKWLTATIYFAPNSSPDSQQNYLNKVEAYHKAYIDSADKELTNVDYLTIFSDNKLDSFNHNIKVELGRNIKDTTLGVIDPRCPQPPLPLMSVQLGEYRNVVCPRDSLPR